MERNKEMRDLIKQIKNETDVVKKFELSKTLHTTYENEFKKNNLDILNIRKAVTDGFLEFYIIGNSVVCEDYMGEIVVVSQI
jgi:hypothetical protein